MKKIITMVMTAAIVALTFTGCYDDDGLWKKVNEIDGRLAKLEKTVEQLNKDIVAMDVIVKALEDGNTITGYTQTADGYAITFDNGETINIKNGTAGSDAPRISVGLYEGVYYWQMTVDGETEWLLDNDGGKMRVTGSTPVIGVNGDGYWTVDGLEIKGPGGTYIKAAGEDGDSFFTGIVDNGDTMTFILSDGTEIEVGKKGYLKFEVNTEGADEIIVKYGTTKNLLVTASGVGDYLLMSKPAGWTVSYSGMQLAITAPEGGSSSAECQGEIGIIVVSTSGTSMIVKVKVKAVEYITHTITFEGAYWEPFVAANYNGGTYTNTVLSNYEYPLWVDPATKLTTLAPTQWEYSSTYGQGIGYDYPWMLSSYNSRDYGTYGNYKYDMYVYNPANENSAAGGGNNGSDNFLVSFGYDDLVFSWGDFRPVFTFADGQARTIKSLYVNSTCYFFNVAGNGNALSPALGSDDKVILHATGYDAAGNELGTETMTFASFDNFILEWTEWDISALGPVVTLRLNQSGDTDNGSGYSLPAYYAIDDITVIIE